MVVPYKHRDGLNGLGERDLFDMMKVTQKMLRIFDEVMRPQGYNIGVNQGQVAGAGIYEHVHLHIVPRWLGDCNFMPIVSDSKVINEDIVKTYDKLAEAIKRLK